MTCIKVYAHWKGCKPHNKCTFPIQLRFTRYTRFCCSLYRKSRLLLTCMPYFYAASGRKERAMPFQSQIYLERLPWLVEHLDPSPFRLGCASVLTPRQRKVLKQTEKLSAPTHNEDLLDILEAGGEENYRRLLSVLGQMKGMFPAVAEELKTALPNVSGEGD